MGAGIASTSLDIFLIVVDKMKKLKPKKNSFRQHLEKMNTTSVTTSSETLPYATVIEKTDKPWGYELLLAKTEHYVGKILHVDTGHRLSLQYHNEKTETLYVQSGKVLLTYGSNAGEPLQDRIFNIGEGFHVPAGGIH